MITGLGAASAPATAISERRLIRDAKRGDRTAEAWLIGLYEPMARYIAITHFMPGGDRDDLAQHARIGILAAIHAWEPRRRVPFRSFAWLCAVRETRMAANAARAEKHQPLNRARSLHAVAGEDGHPLADTLAATGRPDADPVAKTLGREQLREMMVRTRTLSDLERRALVLSANDHSHRESARALGVGERSVNNALQRARRKALGAGTACTAPEPMADRRSARA
jgi:RNA polymerase sporulation-specific sigma factor